MARATFRRIRLKVLERVTVTQVLLKVDRNHTKPKRLFRRLIESLLQTRIVTKTPINCNNMDTLAYYDCGMFRN